MIPKLLLVLLTAIPAAAQTQLPVTSVTASSSDSNVPANTVDGRLSTRWSAQGDGQWIRYDLGSSKTISSVEIAWYKGNSRTSWFEVQTSPEGSTWTTVFTGASCGKTTALEPFDLVDTVGRYLQVVGYCNSYNDWNSITELKIYGSSGGSTPPPVAGDESRLQVVSVVATSDDGNIPSNTVDGSLSTRWSAYGDGECVVYDLGTSQLVTTVRIAWHRGDQRIQSFDLKTSDDGANWTTVFSGISSGLTSNLESYDVTDTAGRYVCIEGHCNTSNDWNSITEVEIYGRSGDTVPPPPPPPPPPTTATLPAQILNLTNWKLTLPVNSAHAASPDEYLQPELAGFQDANYFHVNDTANGVVFTAPCGGATTSGSGYPRSELREMTNGGKTQASWSTISGTHTMEITQAITHLPDVKRHVVAGQIHNSSDDVIVFRLEDKKLFIDENGDTGPVLTTDYKLGDVFTVKFVARNGGVACYYNGQYIYTYAVSTSGCYFKAGCYTQSNTSKGDAPTAYGEVVVYSLSVTHE